MPAEKVNGHRKENISLVFQNYNLIDYLTPVENVRLGGKEDAMGLLRSMGLDETQSRRNVMQLSGGQQQRVAIGRALIYQPAILLADEPTGNLDRKNTEEIISLLKLSNRQYKQTILLITHDESVALEADRIIKIEDGKIISDKVVRP